jgi:hypothetical protein
MVGWDDGPEEDERDEDDQERAKADAPGPEALAEADAPPAWEPADGRGFAMRG